MVREKLEPDDDGWECKTQEDKLREYLKYKNQPKSEIKRLLRDLTWVLPGSPEKKDIFAYAIDPITCELDINDIELCTYIKRYLKLLEGKP